MSPGQRGVHRIDTFMERERAVFSAVNAAQQLPQPERAALLFYALRLAAELLPMNDEVLAILREADLAADHGLLVATADEALAAWRAEGREPTGEILQLRRHFAASAARLQIPAQPTSPPPA